MFYSSLADEICGYIGEEATAALCLKYGGVDLFIPKAQKPSDKLINTIGTEAALKLCEIYAGERLQMPMLHIMHTKKRHGLIFQDKQKGLKCADIAQKYHYHMRTIFYIFANQKKKLAECNNMAFDF